MKKAYIQPEFELIRLTAVEDILASGDLENNVDDDTFSGAGDNDYNNDDWA